MLEILKQTHFKFIEKRRFFFGLSGLLILISIVSLILHKGPRLGLDFTGGWLVQMRFEKPVALSSLRAILREGGLDAALQDFADQKTVILRMAGGQDANISLILSEILKTKMPGEPFEIIRSEFVGPTIGRHLFTQTFYALFWSFVGIVVYVAFRFKSGIWGVAGVLAIVHDVFITVGLLSVLNKEFTVTVIAALLTLAGYSINDTIVIFDRMRENLRIHRKLTLGELINLSVNETLSRSIITSLTVFLVLVALFFFGGEVIHDFSLALLFGVAIGSYSTIFVASPIVYEWEMRGKKSP